MALPYMVYSGPWRLMSLCLFILHSFKSVLKSLHWLKLTERIHFNVFSPVTTYDAPSPNIPGNASPFSQPTLRDDLSVLVFLGSRALLISCSQAFSFENTRRAKIGPCRIEQAGHRRAILPIHRPCAVRQRPSEAMPVCCLVARRATYGPYRHPLDGPFRRAKNGPSQMRRPACSPTEPYSIPHHASGTIFL